ncbi:MAG: DUF1194 domain-containing protein [Paracoccaceae bacterium]|nr:DUF1194 domain-containing protein [Paracoccaceae bacterium]
MVKRALLSSLLAITLATGTARACDTALILAIDVSNSIDSGEYRIQAEGLAEALLDPLVREALVSGQVALTVIQWSGVGNQVVSIPWRRIAADADVLAIAEEARRMQRAIIMSNTAVGDLVRFARTQFAAVPDCARKVIDISGDGDDNAGTLPEAERLLAERDGVTINALAIESLGLSITNYYRLKVITRNGFVMTARGHSTYAETLKEKIRREVAKVMF